MDASSCHGGAGSLGGGESLAEMEQLHIAAVLTANDWNISKSAAALDIDRGTLYNKIKKYELHNPTHAAG